MAAHRSTNTADAGRAAGRSSAHPRQKLLFGWGYEDERIELEVMPAGRILVLAGSIGVGVHLAAAGRSVDIVDANAAQLAYARRRAAGGPVERGSVERFLDLGRGLVRAASPAWSRAKVRALLEERSRTRAVQLWDALDNRTFRGLLKATLGPAGSLAAAVQRDFQRPVPPHFVETLRARLAEGIARHDLHDNRFAWRLLLGEELPGHRLPEPPADSMRFFEHDVLTHLERSPRGTYDGVALGNIGDGAPAAWRDAVIAAALEAARPGAPVLLRSFHSTADAADAARADADRALIWGSIRLLRREERDTPDLHGGSGTT